MAYLCGVLLALATGGAASVIGFERNRSFYPVMLIVIASYYCLFAAMGGSTIALWLDAAVFAGFAVAAVVGFRTNLWCVVAALAAHGAMDLIHRQIIANPGVPLWWPAFCSAFDLTAAAYLATRLALARKRKDALTAEQIRTYI